SQRLGLREEIIQRARGHLSQDEIKVEELIGQIERDRMAAERDRLEMARGKEEAARIKADYQQRWKELRDKEKGILEKARWESREALRRTKAELGEIIETLRREGREAGEKERERAIARARGALAHIGEEIEVASVSGEEAAHQRPPLTVLKPGQRVYVTGLNLEATVLAAAEGDEVLVQAGLLKVKVKLADLRGVEEPVTREKGPAGVRAGGLGRPPGGADKGRRAFRVSTSEDPRTVSQDRGGTGIGNEERDNYGQLSAGKATDISSELDLRGLMADEAIERTDKFLDDAFLAGAPKVRIIHGKGTGALRRAIGEFLRHHPHVLSQRLGLFGEGGDGVTIVELR
ncbi:MAG: Smr/MutS family protein, partial [Firmicutes bacterium]|nr:Smr/MutS family protein [Bacillota bacterium]